MTEREILSFERAKEFLNWDEELLREWTSRDNLSLQDGKLVVRDLSGMSRHMTRLRVERTLNTMQESEKARQIATELVHLSNKAHEFFKPVVEAYAQVEKITGYRYFSVCEHDVFTPVAVDDSGVCLESESHYCGEDYEEAQDVKIPWRFFDDPEAVLKEAQEAQEAKDRAHAQDSYRRAQEELERAQKNLERVKEKYGL